MRKRRVVGRIYGMKYSWKGHKDTRNRQKNRGKKRSGQARLVYIKNVNRNGPTTWRWARGDHKTRHFENLRTEQWAHPIYKTSSSSKQKNRKKLIAFLQRIGVLMRFPASPKYGESTAVWYIVNEPARDTTLSEAANQRTSCDVNSAL